jgi:Protein of unknown function (DUF2934)
MASKRKSDTVPVASAGAAAAPAKAKVTRRHQAATPEVSADSSAAQATPEQPTTLAPEPTLTGPSFEEIAQLAYSYWEARGYQGGCPEHDWLRAEHELRTQSKYATIA